jgi:NAD(P)-dependent dehydrogenase (short-subunit alcohol dehydrogenase family)
MPAQSLSRKTALVTGAARRVGRELALTLARAGMNVVISYRDSADAAAETVSAIQALGVESIAVQLDVRSEASAREAIAAVIAQFGRLDVLVNNAAVFESAKLAEITLAQWDAVFETNARGPFLMAREALPYLKAEHGRIVNLGSLGGSHPWATHGHYCASKAALQMLTQTMAKAFAPEVSVNCVAPGWIEMDGAAAGARFAAKTPMGRNGAPRDVAEAVLFFAAGPHFVTGQILAVDGGLGL